MCVCVCVCVCVLKLFPKRRTCLVCFVLHESRECAVNDLKNNSRHWMELAVETR